MAGVVSKRATQSTLGTAYLGTGKDYRTAFKATDLESPLLPSPIPLPAPALLLLAGLAALPATRAHLRKTRT